MEADDRAGDDRAGDAEASPACPVCARTDALPVMHGLHRGTSPEEGGYWHSGRCLGPTIEQWHCRGCGCEWPPPAVRFHLFVDVYGTDHAGAREVLANLLYDPQLPEGVEIDTEIGKAIGYPEQDARETIWDADD